MTCDDRHVWVGAKGYAKIRKYVLYPTYMHACSNERKTYTAHSMVHNVDAVRKRIQEKLVWRIFKNPETSFRSLGSRLNLQNQSCQSNRLTYF